MAVRFGATIVPFAGIGSDDGFHFVADNSEISALPIIGPILEQRARDTFPPARR